MCGAWMEKNPGKLMQVGRPTASPVLSRASQSCALGSRADERGDGRLVASGDELITLNRFSIVHFLLSLTVEYGPMEGTRGGASSNS